LGVKKTIKQTKNISVIGNNFNKMFSFNLWKTIVCRLKFNDTYHGVVILTHLREIKKNREKKKMEFANHIQTHFLVQKRFARNI